MPQGYIEGGNFINENQLISWKFIADWILNWPEGTFWGGKYLSKRDNGGFQVNSGVDSSSLIISAQKPNHKFSPIKFWQRAILKEIFYKCYRDSHFGQGGTGQLVTLFLGMSKSDATYLESQKRQPVQFERICRYVPPSSRRTFVIPHWQYVYFLTSFNLNEQN